MQSDGASSFTVDRVQVNGQGCDGFWSDTWARTRAGSGDYELVVLVPAIFEPGSTSIACFDRFRALVEGAGSALALMATAHVSSRYPDGFDAIHDGLASYASQHSLIFVPAGAAWRRVLGDSPSWPTRYEFYSPDTAHPSYEGSYMYVLALYGAIRQHSVVGLGRNLPALRCDPNQACLSLALLEACVSNHSCVDQNGIQRDANGDIVVIHADEALEYQLAVDAALAARGNP